MDNLTLEALKEETKVVPSAKELSYLSVKRSSIQGLGLFTSIDLPSSHVLFKINGSTVYQSYSRENSVANPNWLGVGYQKWIEIEQEDIGVYINHSCKPNVMVNENLEVVSITPIFAHNELLLDYSTTELDPYWTMNCTCGQHNCRKILRSFQYLPLHLQEEYKRYLSPAFINGLSPIT